MDERHDFLIEPAELKAAMADGALVLDARHEGAFELGHIRGALPFSTYDALVPATSLEGMTAFAADMAGRYSVAGASHERPIIVYDEETGPRAARELWILEYLGHRNARLLHGGIRQWIAQGRPVDTDTEIPTVRSKRFRFTVASGGLASANEVCRRAGRPNFAALDVRDEQEWSGATGAPCCTRRGRVPHAFHIEWTQFLENGRFKSPQAIRALLAAREVDPEWEIATYSHQGARAASAYYALRYAGCGGARNFFGSWHEWSARIDLPVEH